MSYQQKKKKKKLLLVTTLIKKFKHLITKETFSYGSSKELLDKNKKFNKKELKNISDI